MPDEIFSDSFFKCLRVIQAVEIPKQMVRRGICPHDHEVVSMHPLDFMAYVSAHVPQGCTAAAGWRLGGFAATT
jgi:hypothetical protein